MGDLIGELVSALFGGLPSSILNTAVFLLMFISGLAFLFLACFILVQAIRGAFPPIGALAAAPLLGLSALAFRFAIKARREGDRA